MLSYEPQMGTRSEDIGNTAQSPFAKIITVSNKFSETNAYGKNLPSKMILLSVLFLKMKMVFIQTWTTVQLHRKTNDSSAFTIGFKNMS